MSDFLAACRRQPVSRVPVWFMRQAGRHLPEYRALRGGGGTLFDAVADPALAAEITLQPVRRYGVDAAILYSDIMVPVHAAGFGVEIRAGVGPVVAEPFRTAADLDRLPPFDPAARTPYVGDAARLVTAELAPSGVPLIGFAGAPFTVASYLVEGGPSREHLRTKAMMFSEPELWAALLDRLADYAIATLRDQVRAGAAAVQLFDSWAGALTPDDYRASVLPASAKVLAAVAGLGVPRIHFGVGTGELLGLLAEAGADVVGVDWRVPLAEAARRTGGAVALQGNLDPAAVTAGWGAVEPRARRILAEGSALPGHVFNLGHGVLPDTDPAVLARLVDLVHAAPPPAGPQGSP
ncbi:MAG TPA: uroporphyrinogen decarboxylase [Acidimicrobiales bacterium]|nr:uroporphyrinogen decarboxylase [Acidimicrobiales bacterium]